MLRGPYFDLILYVLKFKCPENMLKNYFVVAIRNIIRSKFYSLINIVGLSTGILAAILITLYVKDELGYDKFNSKHERIFRIESHFNIGGSDDQIAVTSAAIGPALAAEYPYVEKFVRFAQAGGTEFNLNGKKFEISQSYWVDTTYFEVFDNIFIAGDSKTALTQPDAVVLTESLAKSIFGNQLAIGKTFNSSDNQPFTVTAVIKDLPRNTHMKFDALFSIKTIEKRMGSERFNNTSADAFFNVNVFTYVLLKQPSDINDIVAKNGAFYQKYMASVGDKLNAKFRMEAQPLADIHFSTKNLKGDQPVGDRSLLIIFSFVAIIILLIAAINYMNLATAQSANRSKEVGIRKVMGAERKRLIIQFLVESTLISLASLILAIVAAEALLDPFNQITGKNISPHEIAQPLVLIISIGITLFTGLVSGSYPAIYLSSFVPTEVLNGKANSSSGRIFLRKLSVVIQFTVSVVLIIGTIVVTMQQSFIRNKELGFNSKNLYFYRETDTTVRKKVEVLRERLISTAFVEDVAATGGPMGLDNDLRVFKGEQEKTGMQDYTINAIYVDPNLLPMLNIPIIEGRNFEKGNSHDRTNGYIINESAAKLFGWGKNAVGKRAYIVDGSEVDPSKVGQIIGVVKDFHFQNIHNKIEPLVIYIPEFPLRTINFRIKEGRETEARIAIENIRKELGATTEITIYPLKEKINEDYQAEQKLGWLFRAFSLLTIFTSIIGLMGLTSYLTEQRSKEISIRKVLGARSWGIAGMVTYEFVRLVLVANIIAWPIAYYVSKEWLQNFAYHIEFGLNPFSFQTLIPFLLASLTSLAVAIITVGWLAKKAAETDPVFALKAE